MIDACTGEGGSVVLGISCDTISVEPGDGPGSTLIIVSQDGCASAIALEEGMVWDLIGALVPLAGDPSPCHDGEIAGLVLRGRSGNSRYASAGSDAY